MIRAETTTAYGVSSESVYSDAKTWGWQPGQMKSVFIDGQMDLEVYNRKGFKANTITLKNYATQGKCHEIKQNFKNRADSESLRLRTMETPRN